MEPICDDNNIIMNEYQFKTNWEVSWNTTNGQYPCWVNKNDFTMRVQENDDVCCCNKHGRCGWCSWVLYLTCSAIGLTTLGCMFGGWMDQQCKDFGSNYKITTIYNENENEQKSIDINYDHESDETEETELMVNSNRESYNSL